jgi:hypothetical protein
MPMRTTDARYAELTFDPDSTEEERADAVRSILRLVADLEHPAVVELAFYDETRRIGCRARLSRLGASPARLHPARIPWPDGLKPVPSCAGR